MAVFEFKGTNQCQDVDDIFVYHQNPPAQGEINNNYVSPAQEERADNPASPAQEKVTNYVSREQGENSTYVSKRKF